MQLIDTKDQAMKAFVATSVSQAKQEIEGALAAAITQQSKSLESSMADLKQFIKSSHAKQKRSRDKTGTEMETDTEH